VGVQRINDLLVREHPRVGLLGGLDLPHQKLAQPSFADVPSSRRCAERPVRTRTRDPIIQSDRPRPPVGRSDRIESRKGRRSYPFPVFLFFFILASYSRTAAYRTQTSSDGFPVPASAFNATPNLVLSTAAISYFWIFRSPLAYVRSSSRSNSESPATATEHATLLAAKLCGKPPICALGLFIFVISMRDFFSFHAKGRDSRSSRARVRRDVRRTRRNARYDAGVRVYQLYAALSTNQ